MTVRIFYFVFSLWISLSAFAADFSQANQAFENGDYAKAIELYESLASDGPPRTNLFQNLGSAYYQNKDYGKAILAFERGLQLSPGNKALKKNHTQALKKAEITEISAASFREKASQFFSRKALARLCLLGIFFATALIVFHVLKGMKTLKSRLLIVCGILCSLGISMVTWSFYQSRSEEVKRAIITQKNTAILLSPFASAEKTGSFPQGLSVYVQKQRNGYFYVTSIGSSKKGWIAEKSIGKVIP